MSKDYVSFECVHIAEADPHDSDERNALAYADIDGYTVDETEEGTVICRVWLLRRLVNGRKAFIVDWHHNAYRNNEWVSELIEAAKEDLKAYVKVIVEKLEQNAYKKYKLKWMLDHNYTLDELMEKLQVQMENGAENVMKAFEQMQQDTGFDGDLWACEEDFRDSDEYDALMYELLTGDEYRLWKNN